MARFLSPAPSVHISRPIGLFCPTNIISSHFFPHSSQSWSVPDTGRSSGCWRPHYRKITTMAMRGEEGQHGIVPEKRNGCDLLGRLLDFFNNRMNALPWRQSQKRSECTTADTYGCVPRIMLGPLGFEVSAQGLGCMGMSAFYGAPKPEPDMIALIQHAIRTGVTHLDTSDFYGPHINEILVGKAIKGMRGKVQLATKFGMTWAADGVTPIIHGDPAYVRAACEGSLKRLGVDYIDLYYQHRVDATVPIEVTMGELKKLVEEGKIKYVGLSEASASTIRRAHAVHPITAVQLEWSLWTRDAEEELIPTCRELGIGIVAYSPLGRGFFTSGPKVTEKLEEGDVRKHLPRFQAENLEHNARILARVNEIATRKGCTVPQLALAWVHHQGNDVCPIPGTTKVENFNTNVGALFVKLTPEEMAELESLAAPDAFKGGRYAGDSLTWKTAETPPLESWKGK